MSETHFHPEQFSEAAKVATGNEYLQKVLHKATFHSLGIRDSVVTDFPDWEQMRETAHLIRKHAIDHLDELLIQLEENCTKNGVQVHYARNTNEARALILSLLQKQNAKRVVKSKSMTSEEIELNSFLEESGIEAVETDLGEYIVQLEGKPPSHITAPALHLSREQIGKLFHEHIGTDYTDDPETLTKQARLILREKFLHADAGVSGVNFACADTGRLVVVENEGNGRFCTSYPKLHIAVCGIEKVIAHEFYLAVLLRMLARSATGQRFTTYTNFLAQPRRANESDGPETMHLVLLDNGRSKILADVELRESLLCIRCGACLNVCPVYQHAGGHAYGSAYMGPIGAVLTPQFKGYETTKSLPFASSLCGACAEICPVKIPLPEHLLTLRQRIAEREKLRPGIERMGFAAWANTMLNPSRYERAGKFFTMISKFGWNKFMPGWTPLRKPLNGATISFRERWRRERGGKS